MKTITGDLLSINEGLILHQVNCVGACGGLAGSLRRKHPSAFACYFGACVQKQSPKGTTVIGVASTALLIAHVFGQKYPGANTDLVAVESALADLAEQISSDPFFSDVELFAPYLMGCGLGGGRWDQYLPLLEKYLPQLTLVKLPD